LRQGSKEARKQRGKEAKRQRGKEAKRQRGKEAKRIWPLKYNLFVSIFLILKSCKS